LDQVNPYEAPKAQVADLEEAPGKLYLASRSDRFWASLVDGLLGLPLAFAISMVTTDEPLSRNMLIGVAALSAVGLGVFALQLALLHSNGWSVGKRLMKIRIVRVDGTRAGLARIFWLRMAPVSAIAFIPCVGVIFAWVDALFIFRDDRRCPHDWFAGTKVVNDRSRKRAARRYGSPPAAGAAA
jgi:uncharacterized RDD family membrane protein YckC